MVGAVPGVSVSVIGGGVGLRGLEGMNEAGKSANGRVQR